MWALNPMTSVVQETVKEDGETPRRGHVKLEADTGVILPQAKERQEPPEPERKGSLLEEPLQGV